MKMTDIHPFYFKAKLKVEIKSRKISIPTLVKIVLGLFLE